MNITKDQAIKELSESIDMMRSYKVDEDESRLMQALRMAISALKQQPCETSTDEPMTMVYPTIYCDDAISREAVINAIYKMELSNWVKDDTEKMIRELPSVQPIHRDRTVQDFVDKCRECGRIRKGHWIERKESLFNYHDEWYECNKCHGTQDNMSNFCPNCGADMRGDTDASN